MWRRDPRDRRYPERLAGSTLTSLLIHALLAILLFAVVANTAFEGATESVTGGTLVTLERKVPAVAQVPTPVRQAAPVPHASIAPVQHPPAAQPPRQKQPPRRPELSHIVPSAPPQPSPLPQASIVPTALPTQPLIEPQPQRELPAVPTSVPTAAAVAVTVTIPPTAAPSPAPTAPPTAKPTPRPPAPTAAPTAKPQTPAPAATVAPTAQPSPQLARASAAPSASPAPAARVSAPPAPHPGVPSPTPTKGAAPAKSAGKAPRPGAKGHAKPGPHAGNARQAKPGPSRAINVPPTPAPARNAKSGGSGIDINARLRAMLPHGPVTPSEKSYHEPISLGSINPTPPPAVVAETKYILEEAGSGGDARIKMWVTSVHREGPLLICDGWMLRFPRSSQPPMVQGTFTHPLAGGIGITIGGNPGGVGKPIVEERASAVCTRRALAPFTPPQP